MAQSVERPSEIQDTWARGRIPISVDTDWALRRTFRPQVVVDAIIAKRNPGTHLEVAPLVIALAPCFEVGRNVHFVIETNRGHYLGQVITAGKAESHSGPPAAGLCSSSINRIFRTGRMKGKSW